MVATAPKHMVGRTVLVVSVAIFAGCFSSEPPLPPKEALLEASARIDGILADYRESHDSEAAQDTGVAADGPVTLWYCAHPVLAPILGFPDWEEKFHRTHPGVEVETQYIGDWSVGVQKLTVNLAVNEPPDVALVERSWMAALAHSGHLAKLDEVLTPELVADLRAPFRESLTIDGHLYGLPADGFVSLLFVNQGLVAGESLATWDRMIEAAEEVSSASSGAIGHFPFEEALWSAGGRICDDATSRLTSPEALEALTFVTDLRRSGLLGKRTWRRERLAFEAFLRGDVAMTVASSRYAPRSAGADFPVGLGPVPGNEGSVSRMSSMTLVVFDNRASSKKSDIAALCDFLTGAQVQGAAALALGSLPVRTSVANDVNEPAWAEALSVAQNTPLVGPWGAVEHEVQRYVERAMTWAEASPLP